MTRITETKPNRARSVKQAVGLALSVCFVLGTFVASARADDHGEHHGWNGEHHGWHGPDDRRFYPPPPVVYQPPYYYPPPVVYGPGVGIQLPGFSLNIR